MIDKASFLRRNGISEERFALSGLEWEDLERIHDDYQNRQSELWAVGRQIADMLQRKPGVHSIKLGIKEVPRCFMWVS